MRHKNENKWTDEKIKEEILNIKDALMLDRMPTRKEIVDVTNSNSLPCKISKTKGYYGWAKELNLKVKNSETTFGKEQEFYIKDKLENMGYSVDKMAQNYPYDLLINDNIRVDVKASRLYKGESGSYYTFNLYKKYATCDLYICLCYSDDKKIDKILIIPAHKLKITQLSIGKTSIYDEYKDRYDLIDKYDRFYQEVV
jgi:hypothetical protein